MVAQYNMPLNTQLTWTLPECCIYSTHLVRLVLKIEQVIGAGIAKSGGRAFAKDGRVWGSVREGCNLLGPVQEHRM